MTCEYCPMKNIQQEGCPMEGSDFSTLELAKSFIASQGECKDFNKIYNRTRTKVGISEARERKLLEEPLTFNIDIPEFLQKNGLTHLSSQVEAAVIHRYRKYPGILKNEKLASWRSYLYQLTDDKGNVLKIEDRRKIKDAVELLIPQIKD